MTMGGTSYDAEMPEDIPDGYIVVRDRTHPGGFKAIDPTTLPGSGGGGGSGSVSLIACPYDFNDGLVPRTLHTILAGQTLLGILDIVTTAFNGNPNTANHVGLAVAGEASRYINDNLETAAIAVGGMLPASNLSIGSYAEQAQANTDIVITIDNGAGGASGATVGAGIILLLIAEA